MPGERSVALASLATVAANLPASLAPLRERGVQARLLDLLAAEPSAREQGRALMALGALHEANTAAPLVERTRAALREGLRSPERLVRRQAVLAATLARDEALDAALLFALQADLGTAATATAPAPAGNLAAAALRIPELTAGDPRAVELLPLLPAYTDLLLSLDREGQTAYAAVALRLSRALATAAPRSGVAHFFLARAADRLHDPAALPALRRAFALGNLPDTFAASLGDLGPALAAHDVPDTAAQRARVRAILSQRPRRRPAVPLAAAAGTGPGPGIPAAIGMHDSPAVREVDPAALEQAAAESDKADQAAQDRLGARLFATYPFGSEVYYDSCLRSFLSGDNSDLLDRLGLVTEDAHDGAGPQLVGVVAARRDAGSAQGPPRLGVTCAVCHARVEPDGRRWDGLPSRTYDQGLLLAACVDQPIHHKSGNRNIDDLLSYGPGRNDSTSDGVHNPTKIPPLFGLRAGRVVRLNGDTPTLEVQIDRNLAPRAAPPAVLRLVAGYLRRLPLPPAAAVSDPAVAAGAEVFAATCERCHSPPAWTTGAVISLAKLGTDAARVSAVLPNSTEGYKVPSLLRVALSPPYLHDGSLPTLAALLDPRRGGGHRFGLNLSARDRAALLAFVQTL